jgi:hypothetical protein
MVMPHQARKSVDAFPPSDWMIIQDLDKMDTKSEFCLDYSSAEIWE